jgi:hypothetical protein
MDKSTAERFEGRTAQQASANFVCEHGEIVAKLFTETPAKDLMSFSFGFIEGMAFMMKGIETGKFSLEILKQDKENT